MAGGMWLQIDPLAPEPLFRQVCAGVKAAVARGQLKQGERLPSVRELAHELAINPNTVAKAYGELEHEGVIVRRQGAGCFVHGGELERSAESRRQQLQRLTERLAIEAYHLGLDAGELRQALEYSLAKLGQGGATLAGHATNRESGHRDADLRIGSNSGKRGESAAVANASQLDAPDRGQTENAALGANAEPQAVPQTPRSGQAPGATGADALPGPGQALPSQADQSNPPPTAREQRRAS
jgi:GntR family transcriptional regulator